jgi:hypothetical protein
MEQTIMTLLFGSSGIAVIIATVMHHVVKAVWKPENKNLYKIPAGVLSLGGGYIARQAIAIAGFWPQVAVYLLLSAFIMAFQLYGENEAWDDIKSGFWAVLRLFVIKK